MMPSTLVEIAPSALQKLRVELDGAVLTPTDALYAAGGQPFNLSFSQRPALIVMAESASDVAAAVRFAVDQNLGIAIQATGHGMGRPADGAVLINTSSMNDVMVDVQKGTAWIEAGAQWRDVLKKTTPHGLAPLLGSSETVGAVGYTLGGGTGWLVRKYGMAADSVNFFEVVTSDGKLRASATENADLFWALRGGGGNFGVVTAMEVKLYPEKTIFGGNLFYPATLAREVLARFREWVTSHPAELTASVQMMHFPPLPQMPEMLRGQSFIMVRGVHLAPAEAGDQYLQYWLDWQQPIMNTWGMLPFSEIASVSNEPASPVPALISGAWLHDLTDEAIDTILQFMATGEAHPLLAALEIRHFGDALPYSQHEAAFHGTPSRFSFFTGGITPTPEIHQLVKATIANFKAALGSALTGKVGLNFTEGEERRTASPNGYTTENYHRLQAVKAKYDPENRFDYGFAIPPHSGNPDGR